MLGSELPGGGFHSPNELYCRKYPLCINKYIIKMSNLNNAVYSLPVSNILVSARFQNTNFLILMCC